MKSVSAAFSIAFHFILLAIALSVVYGAPIFAEDPPIILLIRVFAFGTSLSILCSLGNVIRDWNRVEIDDPYVDIIFATAPWQNWLRLAGSLVLGSGFLILAWEKLEISTKWQTFFVAIGLVICVGAIWRHFFARPWQLILTPAGLDYPPIKGSPFAWQNILYAVQLLPRYDLGLTSMGSIRIGLDNIDTYLARGFRRSWFRRIFPAKNRADLIISPYFLGTTPAMVEHAIEIRRRAFGQAIAGSRQLPSRPSSIVERH